MAPAPCGTFLPVVPFFFLTFFSFFLLLCVPGPGLFGNANPVFPVRDGNRVSCCRPSRKGEICGSWRPLTSHRASKSIQLILTGRLNLQAGSHGVSGMDKADLVTTLRLWGNLLDKFLLLVTRLFAREIDLVIKENRVGGTRRQSMPAPPPVSCM